MVLVAPPGPAQFSGSGQCQRPTAHVTTARVSDSVGAAWCRPKRGQSSGVDEVVACQEGTQQPFEDARIDCLQGLEGSTELGSVPSRRLSPRSRLAASLSARRPECARTRSRRPGAAGPTRPRLCLRPCGPHRAPPAARPDLGPPRPADRPDRPPWPRSAAYQRPAGRSRSSAPGVPASCATPFQRPLVTTTCTSPTGSERSLWRVKRKVPDWP